MESLLSAIAAMEHTPQRMPSLDTKTEILLKLEDAAQVVSRQVSKRLQSGDRSTNAWFSQMCKRSSESIRELKKHVMSSSESSHSAFLRDTSFALQNVASGNWSALADIAPQSSLNSSRLSTAISFIWHFVVAILPLVFFWLYQQTPIAVEGDAANYFSIVLFILALITFIAIFDPLYATKQAILRDMPGLWPFKRRDG